MSAQIVFFDIAGPDASQLKNFYANVFDWPCEGGDTFSPGVAPDLSGTIREDPAEKVLYFGVPDITATLERVVANGGTIDAPRFEVPGRVVVGLFRDPAGNRLGLIEMVGNEPRVP